MKTGQQRELLLEHIGMGHLLPVEASTAHRMRAKMAAHMLTSTQFLFCGRVAASCSTMT
jgi:hypothetical protein